ncbi:MAG: ABC transporter substrate-binding protein [Chloroflexota bacterium]
MKLNRLRLIGLLAAAAMIVPAHIPPPARAASPNLVIDVGYEGSYMDPAQDYDTGMATVLGNVYDGLVRASGSKTVKIVPDLATSWKESKDGKTWTFTLRSGVKFHDGNPVNAAAVKFSFDRLQKLQSGAVGDFLEISSVDAPNPSTVVFHLSTAYSGFLPSLTALWGPDIVSPKTVLAHQVHGDLGKTWMINHDAGSGPWMVQQWVRGQKIVLVPFPGYWKGWSGQHVGEVVLQWPAASSTQRQGLEHGDVDIAMNLNYQDFAAVGSESGIVTREYKAQTIREIRFNSGKSPLNNQLVRQALSYTFDYDTMVKAVFKGHGARMQGVGPTGLANFIPEKNLYTYDLAKAKSLLVKAGYPHGFPLEVDWQTGDQQSALMAQIWQADTKSLGIAMKLQVLPNAVWSTRSLKESTMPQVWFGQWTMDFADDQNMYLNYFWSKSPPASGNVFWYKNPTLDTYLEQGRGATSSAAARAAFTKAMNLVYNQALEIWAVQQNDTIAMRDNIHGFVYNYLYGAYYYDLYSLSKS